MIRINLQSSVPLVEQLTASLREGIARGELADGQELPSARQLAGDLGIHFNTVARAYKELARQDLIVVAHGRKTIVKPRDSRDEVDRGKVEALLRDGLRRLLTQAKLAGMSATDVTRFFAEETSNWPDGV